MSLAQTFKNSPGFIPANPAFVSLYETVQRYGGPEEGGWWYDVIIYHGCIRFCSEEQAKLAKEQMEKEAALAQQSANRIRQQQDEAVWRQIEPVDDFTPGESVDEKFWTIVEKTPGERDNTNQPRPRYE